MAFRVALTFDAEHADRRYQAPDGTARVLDRLAAEGIRATFFCPGPLGRGRAGRGLADRR